MQRAPFNQIWMSPQPVMPVSFQFLARRGPLERPLAAWLHRSGLDPQWVMMGSMGWGRHGGGRGRQDFVTQQAQRHALGMLED